MPKKMVRFQNKQGDWKTTSKKYNPYAKYTKHLSKGRQGFISSRRHTGGVRLNKRQQQALKLQLTTPNQEFKSHKGNAQGQFIPDSKSGHIKISQYGKKNQYKRVHEVAIDDKETGIIHLSEEEEASRYTPSKTVDVFQHTEGKLQVFKINPRDQRIVSKTEINVLPPEKHAIEIYDKIERYKTGEELQTRRDLVPIADALGIKTGAPTEKRLKREINKKLGITERERQQKNKTLKSAGINQSIKTQITSKDPEPPIKNITNQPLPGRKATPEDIQYWNRVKNDPITNEKKFEKFEAELEEWTKVRYKDRDPLPAFSRLRERFDKDYSRYQQDKYLLKLERQQKIDLQTASDQRLKDFGTGLATEHRGFIYFVNWRR